MHYYSRQTRKLWQASTLDYGFTDYRIHANQAIHIYHINILTKLKVRRFESKRIIKTHVPTIFLIVQKYRNAYSLYRETLYNNLHDRPQSN